MSPETICKLRYLFATGKGVRESARLVGVHRDTAMRERRRWIDDELQRAYDLLCDMDCEGCDTITEKLPEHRVKAMLDAWMDDQDDKLPKSRWY